MISRKFRAPIRNLNHLFLLSFHNINLYMNFSLSVGRKRGKGGGGINVEGRLLWGNTEGKKLNLKKKKKKKEKQKNRRPHAYHSRNLQISTNLQISVSSPSASQRPQLSNFPAPLTPTLTPITLLLPLPSPVGRLSLTKLRRGAGADFYY